MSRHKRASNPLICSINGMCLVDLPGEFRLFCRRDAGRVVSDPASGVVLATLDAQHHMAACRTVVYSITQHIVKDLFQAVCLALERLPQPFSDIAIDYSDPGRRVMIVTAVDWRLDVDLTPITMALYHKALP